jgi:hypothetical protein
MSASRNEPLADPEQEAIQRFVQHTIRKRELNDELRALEPQLRALESMILAIFSQNGYQMLKIEGFTLSPKREPWVYPLTGVGRQTVCEALKLSGLGRFVKEGYSTRSLTAYIRELEAHHELVTGSDPEALAQLLPRALAEVLEVRPSFRLQVLDRRSPEEKRSKYEPEEEEEEQFD